MFDVRVAVRLLCWSTLLCAAGAVSAAVSGPTGAAPARIPVSAVAVAPEPVPAWDPDSPQRLVRIDGILFQEDAGFYYRTEEKRITVRLADGVQGWGELVARAKAEAPSTFGALDALIVARANRLGIVDLAMPAGDAAEWCELIFATGLVRYAEVPTRGVYLAVPNDTRYPEQWALNNTGQTGGTAGADVRAQQAWNLATGSPSIIVGILDSGTAVDHVDLAPNVWHNEGEIPGNGQDDDGNGFVDDWEGWDFGNGNNDPRSNNFHGTHVAGIINARGGNNQGVAGLAGGIGGPGVRGMALGVGESGPIGSILDDAILYAADNGAQVITMSLTVGSSSAINDALAYAYGTKDVFIDCAAGNNGATVGYPANRAEVMAVGASDHNDAVASYSNPGPQVEVAAPGSSVLSTQLGNSYGSSSGTSFAAPYVAGLAALIRSMNPGLSAPDVRQLIIDTAVDIGPPGFDNGAGNGRIDAFQALSMTVISNGLVELDRDRYSCDDAVTITVTDSDLAGSGTIQVVLRSEGEVVGESVSLGETSPGSGRFQGNVVTSSDVPAADGALQVVHDDLVTAEYLDADDGTGGFNVVKTATAPTDCAGPLLDGVALSTVDDVSATIVWTTDEPATSRVRFGEFEPLDQQATAPGLSPGHAVQLTGLQPCTVYKYRVESEDDLGNLGIADDGGAPYTFETLENFPGVGLTVCHEGRASVDRQAYACGDTIQVSVTDADLDLDSGTVETIQVLVTSVTEPQGEWLTLTEDSVQSSRFEGAIQLALTAAAADGMLGVTPGDLVTVTYFDTDDGNGQPRLDSVTALTDCLAPGIRDVQVTAISATRAEIAWTTDEPATSRIEYGPTPALGSAVESQSMVTSHALPISAFAACDRVYFRLTSVDALGEVRVADNGGQPFEFNLSRIGGLMFHDNFETDTGWNLRGDWERGVPQGAGSDSADPAKAYSGDTIIGNDLSGLGPFAGDYEPLARERATSPVIDAAGASNLELILRRKLGVDGGDLATLAVLAPSETTVWSSAGSVDDTDWVEVRYDISALADDNASVRIRLNVESNDPGQSFGWNVDELIVKDATQPDYLSCTDCSGAPTFGGLVAAFDADPCGVSGVTLQWEAAPAWGTGGSGAYDVHRSATPGFTPDATNRIASGVTGTGWVDAGAPVDTVWWYAIRARNDESCAGGEGLADGNLVRLAATETVTQGPAASVGNTLGALGIGYAHVSLDWPGAPAEAGYVVRRSTAPDMTGAVELGSTAATSFVDEGVMQDGASYFYRIFAVNACGLEE